MRKFSEFVKFTMICQTKTIQISTYNYLPLINLFIRQTFCQMLEKSTFTTHFKLSYYTGDKCVLCE